MNKTLFVTGAVRNTGRAVAERFAADGWNVVVTSRDAAAAERAAAEIRAAHPAVGTLGVGMDPARVGDVRAAFARAAERFVRLDAFVNCAANLGVGQSIYSTTPEEYDAVLDVNTRGPFFCTQEAVRLMPVGGSVVFISSCHAAKSMPGRICYSVSKAALGGLVRSLAVELGCRGITANAILAGAIRTERWNPLTSEQVRERRDRYPAGRESSPEDIAAAVRFLCSDAARTVTGVELPVDSGIGVCLLPYDRRWLENDADVVKQGEK